MKKLQKTIISCIACLMLASSYATPPSEGNLISNSSVYMALKSILSMTNNMIKNRIFIGPLAGCAILPTQHWPNQRAHSGYVLHSCNNDKFEVVEVSDFNFKMKLIICYPPNWNKSNKSKCTVFCNPNGALISSYIDHTAYICNDSIITELLKNGPVVLFDYPNTGINYNVNESKITGYCSFLKYTTENQILDCSEAVLNYVAKKFDHITVAGMSLGGAIATITLERYLQKNIDTNHNRFKLINIDSFTSIPRVVMPQALMISDILGWLFGVNMDAQTSMKFLLNHGINILVFNHIADGVIPLEARMTQYTTDFKIKQNITSINSKDSYGHCCLDEQLKEQVAIFFKKTN